MTSVLRIGTRGSKLALYQAELVAKKLRVATGGLEFELVKIQTPGDRVQQGAIPSIGPGVFTRSIEEALLAGRIDIAVHSAKDLASEIPKGLEMSAYLERDDARDCLVARGGQSLKLLPKGARLGTSSLRRKAQLKRLRKDLKTVELRGNVDTRIKKIDRGECDGMILAVAGLKRLGLEKLITEIFEPDQFLPQAGQGAIAVQIRENEAQVRSLTRTINHAPTEVQVTAERSFLSRLQGGCQLPAGIYAYLEDDRLALRGAIFSLEGVKEVTWRVAGRKSQAIQLGTELAEKVLGSGGKEILDGIRNETQV